MPTPKPPDEEPFTFWHGLLLVEAAAAMIALLMPITPSKTGSDADLAELFFDNPGYPLQVLVYFVTTNLLVALLALAAWFWLRRSGSRGGQ